MSPNQDNRAMLYELNQWPPAGATLLLAAQWLVVMVPGVLVLGEVAARVLGMSPEASVQFVQRLFILSGLVQAAQIYWGHGLPAVVGPSSVILVGVIASAGSGTGAIYGAMAVGGALTALVGLFRLAAGLKRLFTPAVLAATLILVAISLGPVMRDLIFHPSTGGRGFAGGLLFALGLVGAMLWAQYRLTGLWASAVLIIGMVAGSAVYHLFGMGTLEAARQVSPASWLPPLLVDEISFSPAVIGAFAVCYLALISNELASVEATGEVIGTPADGGRLNRAVAVSGLGGLAAGLAGSLGPVTYAVSPGVAVSSRSASRFTLAPCAAAMVALGLWPQGLALFALAPPPVIGAVLFTVMASQIMASFQLLFGQGRGVDWATGAVVGGAVMTALVVSFMPLEAKQAVTPLLRPLVANGFVAGLAMALILEHLLLRRPRNGK